MARVGRYERQWAHPCCRFHQRRSCYSRMHGSLIQHRRCTFLDRGPSTMIANNPESLRITIDIGAWVILCKQIIVFYKKQSSVKCLSYGSRDIVPWSWWAHNFWITAISYHILSQLERHPFQNNSSNIISIALMFSFGVGSVLLSPPGSESFPEMWTITHHISLWRFPRQCDEQDDDVS